VERDIEQRTLAFAVRILRLVAKLPRDEAGRAIARQLSRSGTSVGANVEEAQGALSRREFVYKINVARSEARETLYWLRLIVEMELFSRDLIQPLLTEADELVRILTAIVKSARGEMRSTAI
jgi:four helix bundle protein